MEGSVLLGVRLVPTQYKSVKIDNVNLESKVDSFKEEAAKKINHPKECIGRKHDIQVTDLCIL